jgi:uncharacterized membrane protein YgcG
MRKRLYLLIRLTVCFFLLFLTNCGPKNRLENSNYPKRTSFVNDFELVLRPKMVDSLNNYLFDLSMNDGIVLIVATLRFNDTISGDSFENYTLNLARNWNIGNGKGKGVLIAFSASQRMWRVQLTDDLTRVISPNEIKEQFNINVKARLKKGNYSSGIGEFTRLNVELIKRKLNQIN